MQLGLYRREHLHSGDPRLIGAATVEQFQRTHGALNEWAAAEHAENGSHGAIHAESLDVAGDATIRGTLDVAGDTTLGGRLDVAGEAHVGSHIFTAGSVVAQGAAQVELFAIVGTPISPGPVNWATGRVTAIAGFVERDRPVPLGDWQDEPYDAAAFGADAPLIFQPAASEIVINRFTLIGHTLHWKLVVNGATVGGSGGGALRLRLPGGLVSARANATGGVTFALATGAIGIYDTAAGSPTLLLYPLPALAFAPGPITMWAQFTVEIL